MTASNRPMIFLDTLRKRWAEGVPTRDIADELGVSKNVIVGLRSRLNLPKRESPIKKGNTLSTGRHRKIRAANTLPESNSGSPSSKVENSTLDHVQSKKEKIIRTVMVKRNTEKPKAPANSHGSSAVPTMEPTDDQYPQIPTHELLKDEAFLPKPSKVSIFTGSRSFGECRWIDDQKRINGRASLDMYCNKPTKSARCPYCEEHAARAYVRPGAADNKDSE